MLKPNRNDCKNGKQTNLLVHRNRSVVQNPKKQWTKNSQQTTKYKVCLIHLSDISYLCLGRYVNLKQNNQNI